MELEINKAPFWVDYIFPISSGIKLAVTIKALALQ